VSGHAHAAAGHAGRCGHPSRCLGGGSAAMRPFATAGKWSAELWLMDASKADGTPLTT